VNLYYLWKVAEVVSGHRVNVSDGYQIVEHLESKESTGKWFAILLLPVIAIVLGGLSFIAGEISGMPTGSAGGFVGLFLGIFVAPLAALYLLYKMSIPISGHEKIYGEMESMDHMDKKESTVKWMMFGLTGALTIYYLWKASQIVSGHEVETD